MNSCLIDIEEHRSLIGGTENATSPQAEDILVLDQIKHCSSSSSLGEIKERSLKSEISPILALPVFPLFIPADPLEEPNVYSVLDIPSVPPLRSVIEGKEAMMNVESPLLF